MPVTTNHRPLGTPRERLLLIGGFGQSEFQAALRETDWLVEEILDGREALELAPRLQYGVVLCSLRMETAWGMDVLEAILKVDRFAAVIISTHESSPRVVVEAMQRGAFDYVLEPYADVPEVMRTIERAVRRRLALRQGLALKAELASTPLTGLVGHSAPLRELCETIRQAAPAESPVLIEGESGTGKELVARAVHDSSRRASGPFIALHCGAIPENLLESELFGHEKGAFTGAETPRAGVFEAAHGGTLFLDEIGLTSPGCQTKLLRVLENGTIRRVGASAERTVDVRVVSATNEPLAELVAQRRFRADLFYRLNVVSLKVPPLRERREDIPLLCCHFAERFAKEAGKAFAAFTPQALAAFAAHDYPGNVRELRNAVERALVFAREPVIGLHDLPEPFRRGTGGPTESPQVVVSPQTRAAHVQFGVGESPGEQGLDARLAQYEKALIEQALERARGNRSQAAKLLQIKRTTLLQRMTKLGLGGSKGEAKPKAPARRSGAATAKATKPRRNA